MDADNITKGNMDSDSHERLARLEVLATNGERERGEMKEWLVDISDSIRSLVQTTNEIKVSIAASPADVEKRLRELEDKASQVKGGVAIISSLVIVSGLLGAGASKLLDFIFSKR